MTIDSAATGLRRPYSTRLAGIALSIATLSLALDASAQSGAARDPTDARAAVPPLIYTPLLTRGAGASLVTQGSWRDANYLAGRIGGWRNYAREARSPEPVASAPSAPAHSTPALPAAKP
jgi:hypothetical protein